MRAPMRAPMHVRASEKKTLFLILAQHCKVNICVYILNKYVKLGQSLHNCATAMMRLASLKKSGKFLTRHKLPRVVAKNLENTVWQCF
jgi:hypothetical protein